MMNEIYHTTSTLQLPWIVESGELRPSPNSDTGIGESVLLWGRTKKVEDMTSSAVAATKYRKAAWREDLFRLVRFALPAEGFLTWKEAVHQQGWTDVAVAEMVADDHRRHGKFNHSRWCCRADPLPLTNVLKVEARRYVGRWQPIELDPGRIVRFRKAPDYRGYTIGGKTFSARRERSPVIIKGVPLYIYHPPMTDDEYADAAFVARRKAEEEDQDNFYRDWD
jgi:hypothetical protein